MSKIITYCCFLLKTINCIESSAESLDKKTKKELMVNISNKTSVAIIGRSPCQGIDLNGMRNNFRKAEIKLDFNNLHIVYVDPCEYPDKISTDYRQNINDYKYTYIKAEFKNAYEKYFKDSITFNYVVIDDSAVCFINNYNDWFKDICSIAKDFIIIPAEDMKYNTSANAYNFSENMEIKDKIRNEFAKIYNIESNRVPLFSSINYILGEYAISYAKENNSKKEYYFYENVLSECNINFEEKLFTDFVRTSLQDSCAINCKIFKPSNSRLIPSKNPECSYVENDREKYAIIHTMHDLKKKNEKIFSLGKKISKLKVKKKN